MVLWLTLHFSTKHKEEKQPLYFPVEAVGSMEAYTDQLFHCPLYRARVTPRPL